MTLEADDVVSGSDPTLAAILTVLKDDVELPIDFLAGNRREEVRG